MSLKESPEELKGITEKYAAKERWSNQLSRRGKASAASRWIPQFAEGEYLPASTDRAGMWWEGQERRTQGKKTKILNDTDQTPLEPEHPTARCGHHLREDHECMHFSSGVGYISDGSSYKTGFAVYRPSLETHSSPRCPVIVNRSHDCTFQECRFGRPRCKQTY